MSKTSYLFILLRKGKGLVKREQMLKARRVILHDIHNIEGTNSVLQSLSNSYVQVLDFCIVYLCKTSFDTDSYRTKSILRQCLCRNFFSWGGAEQNSCCVFIEILPLFRFFTTVTSSSSSDWTDDACNHGLNMSSHARFVLNCKCFSLRPQKYFIASHVLSLKWQE